MLNLFELEDDLTLTENGAVTYASTGSDCLDLFATVGALRQQGDEEIIARFIRAYTEDPDLAMKLLFYARDVRGGLGERRIFRTVLGWLAANKPDSVKKNLAFVAEFGRWDDLLSLLDTPCEQDALACLKEQFRKDLQAVAEGGEVSLLGKWLPSANASSRQTVRAARKAAAAFGLREADYRKALTALRARIRIVENPMRQGDYSFDYSKQPSRAMFKYRKAFLRNDGARYREFLSQVSSGRATLHAGQVMPYELVEACMHYDNWACAMRDVSPEEAETLNATWASLPDFGGDGNALAVVDTSGSMWGRPSAIALSLGLYFAERSRGEFHNRFMEFSSRPRLIAVKGETFVDRLRYVSTFCDCADTNLEAVFDLILNTAVRHHVPQEDLPARLVIISDMEFNCCVRNASLSNFANAKRKYEACGYRLPEIVFWNAASRNRQQPVTRNEQGVALVSGATPRLFAMVAGGLTTPYDLMMDILGSERYAAIAA